jgi:hypothetical protein
MEYVKHTLELTREDDALLREMLRKEDISLEEWLRQLLRVYRHMRRHSLHPAVQEVLGVAAGAKTPASRSEYRQFIEEKHA